MRAPADQSALNPWYREPWPWFLLSLPAAVVVAGIVTTIYAVRTNDGLVVDDYYKQGLAINQTLARDAMAVQMGLRARLDVEGSAVQVSLGAKEGVSLPAALEVVISHPTRQGDDQRATLTKQGEVYRANLSLQGSGLRTVVLEDASRSWRLVAGLQLPARGAELLPRSVAPAD